MILLPTIPCSYHTQSLSNIALPTEALLCSGKKCGSHHSCLQRYYSEIITSLDIAAKQFIPTVNVGVRNTGGPLISMNLSNSALTYVFYGETLVVQGTG